MKVLCKDRHYRRFNRTDTTITCVHCKETISVRWAFGWWEDETKKIARKHTCKARLKELK